MATAQKFIKTGMERGRALMGQGRRRLGFPYFRKGYLAALEDTRQGRIPHDLPEENREITIRQAWEREGG